MVGVGERNVCGWWGDGGVGVWVGGMEGEGVVVGLFGDVGDLEEEMGDGKGGWMKCLMMKMLILFIWQHHIIHIINL